MTSGETCSGYLLKLKMTILTDIVLIIQFHGFQCYERVEKNDEEKETFLKVGNKILIFFTHTSR